MKNETAIEIILRLLSVHTKLNKQCPEVIEVIESYLETEKQQIIEAYRNGRSDQQSQVPRYFNRTSEQVFNETFQK
jgi:hypothetical protein